MLLVASAVYVGSGRARDEGWVIGGWGRLVVRVYECALCILG